MIIKAFFSRLTFESHTPEVAIFYFLSIIFNLSFDDLHKPVQSQCPLIVHLEAEETTASGSRVRLPLTGLTEDKHDFK